MISLLMPVVLCSTVLLSVGIGVATAYGAVIGILYACRASQRRLVTVRPRLVLVPSQTHASGD